MNEKNKLLYQERMYYLATGRYTEFSKEQKIKAKAFIANLISKLGPFAGRYPIWHPLLSFSHSSIVDTIPCDLTGWYCSNERNLLDHTVLFRDGFVTCPYEDHTMMILKCAEKIAKENKVQIRVESLPIKLYNKAACPTLVYCQWENGSIDSKGYFKDDTLMEILNNTKIWDRLRQYRPFEEEFYDVMLGVPNNKSESVFLNQNQTDWLMKAYKKKYNQGCFRSAY